MKMIYLLPEIRVRSLEMGRLLDSGSITGINDGGSGDDGPGYGGGGSGPAYAPSRTDEFIPNEFQSVWSD